MQRFAQTQTSKLALAGGAAAVLAALVALALAAIAPAESVKTIGGVRGKAPPSCPSPKKPGTKPQKVCTPLGSVTGFQMVANKKRAPMRVRQSGRIVAWSVDLGKPSRDERKLFTEGLELGEPSAKISILKPAGKGKFKLTKQSPRVKLDSVLGTKPIFTLKKPIRVNPGNIVALSTSSWISNLAHNGALTSKGDKWRASRDSDLCGDDPNKSDEQNNAELLKGKPQRKVGSVKRYGCTYTTARILYEAYYVPVKGKGGKGGNGGK
jgi:hypothetical protein